MGNYKWINPDGSRMTCLEPGCNESVVSVGRCLPHYGRFYRGQAKQPSHYYDNCPVRGCGRRKVASADMCKRCIQFRWRYTLSTAEVFALFQREFFLCQNPGCTEDTNLHFDHDRACCPPGKFGKSHKVSCGACNRGWLCKGCNNALGMVKEDPRRIEGLLSYLSGERRVDLTTR